MARRRKKRRKSHRLYALIVIILGIAIIAASIYLLFYVQGIEVKGNDYTEDKVILESVQKDKYSVNSLYLLIKYRFKEYEVPGSLTSIKVGLKNPWTVKIMVKEKPIIGYITEDDNYVFFDKTGTVVLKSRELREGVPGIEGADVGETKLYKPLKIKDEKLLKAILDVAQEVKNYDLQPDRIVCAEDGIELYFGSVRVVLGMNVTTEKMAQITPILAKLEGRAGTLNLRYFEDETNVIAFTADPPEDSAVEEGEDTAGGDGSDDSEDGYSEEDYYGDDYSSEDYYGDDDSEDDYDEYSDDDYNEDDYFEDDGY